MKTLRFFFIIFIGLATHLFAEAIPGENDICYDEPYTENAELVKLANGNYYICTGFGGVNCRNIIPIKNISGEDVTNVSVVLTSDGIMSGSFNDGCGVKDDLGTCYNDSDHTVGGELTIFGYSFVYDLDDMTNDDNERDTYTESAVSINFNNKKLYTTYTIDGQDYYAEVLPCGDTGGATYESGPFDSWDTFRDDDTQPPADRNISTKIVNQTFKLSLASLNRENNEYENKTGTGTVDVAIYPANSTTAISNHVTFDPVHHDHVSESDDFNVTQIEQNATVGFKSCSTYSNGTYVLYDDDECSESTTINSCTALTVTQPIWRICYATDNFAVRPYSFRLFGLNAYKRAGEDFNLTIKTVDEANALLDSGTVNDVSSTPNYNKSLSDLDIAATFYVPTSAELTQMQDDTGETDVTTCPSAGSFTFDDNNFTNGTVEGVFRYSETGIIRVNVSEHIGSEFAKVDADDSNDSVRLIGASDILFDTNDINKTNLLLFIPYQFDTNATFKTVNDQNWTYISNEVNNSAYSTYTTPLQGAYIEYTITAKNKDGNVVQNYTKTCFPDIDEVNAPRVNGLKLNTTFDLFLDATIESSKAANLSFYTQGADTSPIWTLNKNSDFNEGNNTTQEWIDQWQFTNGVGVSRVYLSINRKANVTRNPIVITLHDANTSTSWMTNAGATNIFNPAQVDKNIFFYYGRTHAPRQRFVGQDANASIAYEVFCYGTDCDKTLLQDGLNSKTTDDPRWFVNSKHHTIDGSAGDVNQKTYSVGSGYVTQTTAATGNAPDHVGLHYNADRGYPYKTTMQNSASPWLLYDKFDANVSKNEFEVEFINGANSWAGKHETNTTTNANASDKTNRRTMW